MIYLTIRKFEALEKQARLEAGLRQEVVEKGFRGCALGQSIMAEHEQRLMKKNEEKHLGRKRPEPAAALGDHWLCRVDTHGTMAWRSFKRVAENLEARLPTKEEIESLVKPFGGPSGKDDLWVPIQREGSSVTGVLGCGSILARVLS